MEPRDSNGLHRFYHRATSLAPNQPWFEASYMSRPMLGMVSNKERMKSKGLETKEVGERVRDRQEGKRNRKVHYCLPVPLLHLC